MSKPSLEELNESIKDLSAYRDRLKQEVITIAEKLKMPKKKIEITLEENSELKKLQQIISVLVSQRDLI